MALRGTLEHHKTLALANELKIPQCYALGVLESFWHFVARYRPDGDITGIPAKAMCSAMMLRTPRSSQVFAALVHCGFIDKVCERYLVHDWHVHADQSVKKRLQRNRKQFAYFSLTGQRPDMTGQRPDMDITPVPDPDPDPDPDPEGASHLRGALQTLHEYGGLDDERERKDGWHSRKCEDETSDEIYRALKVPLR